MFLLKILVYIFIAGVYMVAIWFFYECVKLIFLSIFGKKDPTNRIVDIYELPPPLNDPNLWN